MEMYPCFDISEISSERLLHEWKWLGPGECKIVAVNPFGDLFLEDDKGRVHWLDVTAGTMSALALLASQFQEASKGTASRKRWFLEELAERAEQKRFRPGRGQCVGYRIPSVFKESSNAVENMYVADLYEYVSFMGDIHRQIRDVPDGGNVRIRIEGDPGQSRDGD